MGVDDAMCNAIAQQRQWSRRDAVVWSETRCLLGLWSTWQRFLWWLIARTPFDVRVIMSRDGARPYLLRATLWPRLSEWMPFPIGWIVWRLPQAWRGCCVRSWQRVFGWLPPVYLHYGFRADEEEELHNHPWFAVSLILSRGYIEERCSNGSRFTRRRAPGDVVIIRRGTYHRILSGHWFSLFIPFKRIDLPEEESWSFWSPERGRLWSWRLYIDEKKGDR